MSGGTFEYQQYRIGDIIQEVENIIENNDSDEVNEYGDRIGEHLSNKTLNEFKTGLHHLNMALIYAQRIDWLIAGDDSEGSFHERLKDDLDEYKENKND
jgi:hypothetical protein